MLSGNHGNKTLQVHREVKSEEVGGGGGQDEEWRELWGLRLAIRQSTLKLECSLGFSGPHLGTHLKVLTSQDTCADIFFGFFFFLLKNVRSHPSEQTQQCV